MILIWFRYRSWSESESAIATSLDSKLSEVGDVLLVYDGKVKLEMIAKSSVYIYYVVVIAKNQR